MVRQDITTYNSGIIGEITLEQSPAFNERQRLQNSSAWKWKTWHAGREP
jgi:hypothetical protein